MKNTSKIPLSDLKLLVKEVIRESLTDRSKSDYVGLPLKPIGKVPEKGKGELKGSGLLNALKPKTDKKVNEDKLSDEEKKEWANFIHNSGDSLSSDHERERFKYLANKQRGSKSPPKKKVDEAGLTSEAGAEDPMSVLSQITTNIGDDTAISKLNPEVAKKKLTVIRSILNSLVAKSKQGQVAEGGPQYKVVAPRASTDAKEDKAREIQCDPKVNEASYKVVAPKSATDAKEDKARTIQTEPKVNEGQESFCSCKGCGRVVDKGTEKCPKCREKQDKASLPPKKNERGAKRPADISETAYKTQGPSYKTFDDSPQLPDAVNDPENA